MAKKSKEVQKKQELNKYLIIAIAVVALVVVAILILKNPGGLGFGNLPGSNLPEVSGTELISNKEKYEGEEIRLTNVIVPDPLFAYIDKADGGKERLFIEPRKTTYCLNFNLDGTLQRGTTAGKEWIFHVSNFTCLN